MKRGDTEGEKERGQLMALEADMAVCQSVLYLTDDPEALWWHILASCCTKDGTQPSRDTSDWGNMVIPWKLPASLDDNIPVYLGYRGCWEQDQKETWDLSWKLWNRILENT